MARWNIAGDTVTLEPGPRRSFNRWLERNRLRIAIALGLVEAVVALVKGFAGVMLPIALVSVLAYFWVRKRVSPNVRRPLWIVAVAQAIAGVAPAGVVVMVALGTVLLVIMLLVLLGDLRR
jgi:4-amino-4-deoxy-L-arabinose transferase-like glycosyltransferase